MSKLEIKNTSDGDALVLTGVDSREGNTVGDDRKSSKTITANAANDEVFALAA